MAGRTRRGGWNTDNLARGRDKMVAQAEARREELFALFDGGVTDFAELAERVGYSHARTARAVLVKHGKIKGSRDPRRFTDAEREKARLMLEDGQSYYAVAAVLGRDQQTVKRNLPGYRTLTPQESAERAVLVKAMNKLARER